MFTLTVNTTSGAIPNGKDTNTATATLMNGSTYISGVQLEFNIVTGNALFPNGMKKITASTSSLGEASVTFTDTVEESVTILVILTSDATVYQMASSSFSSGGSSIYTLTLTATSTASANGKDDNTATATLLNNGVPASGENIIFTIATGHAVFAGNTKTTTVTTDIQGGISVMFTDLTSETVTILATVEKATSVYQTTSSTFAPSQALAILRVYNDNNIEFKNCAPHTWLPSAKLHIEINDKSDSVSWATNKAEVKASGRNGVGTITFPENPSFSKGEDIIITIENSTEYVTYKLTCDFSVYKIRLAGDKHDSLDCATQDQLLQIYNEWGDMSTYNWQLNTENLKYSHVDSALTTEIVDMKNGLVLTEVVEKIKVAEVAR
jgi:hypothetical protein